MKQVEVETGKQSVQKKEAAEPKIKMKPPAK
jgi:hypothetical protein